MLLTLTSGSSEVYTNGYRLEKESTGAYTQEFQVAVNGEDTEKVEIQVPEKESEESPASEETVKEETPEESRKKELREAIEKYNEEKRTGLLLSAGRMEWAEVRMAEAGRQYRNVDRCAELLCCFCASVEKAGRTGGTGKTFGTASDGLSSSASEIYTSDSGRNDSEAGISEDGSRLYENKTGKRQVCI